MEIFSSGYEAYTKIATMTEMCEHVFTMSLVFAGLTLAGVFSSRNPKEPKEYVTVGCILVSSLLFNLTAVTSAIFLWTSKQFELFRQKAGDQDQFALNVYSEGSLNGIFDWMLQLGLWATIFVAAAVIATSFKNSNVTRWFSLICILATFGIASLLFTFSVDGLNEMRSGATK